MPILPCLISLLIVHLHGCGPAWEQRISYAPPDILSIVPSFPALPAKTPEPKESQHQSDQWIPLPEWLGGTWQARYQTLLSGRNHRTQVDLIKEPVTIAVNRISTRGLQRDSSGQIWQYTGAPFIRTIELSDYIERQTLYDIVLLSTSPNLVKTRSLAIVTRNDKNSNKTLDIFVEITTTTYQAIRDGLIQVTYAVEAYDLNDRPRSTYKSTCTETRIMPYQTIDKDERGNLQELFIEFQKHNGLIPPSPF